MELREEYIYYQQHKESFLTEHPGTFVLIKGDEVVGFFDSEQAAYKVGLGRYGNEPFFIKRVEPEEGVIEHPALTLGIL